MAVDLFKKYFNNPDTQYLHTNMICSGARSETDKTFSISRDNATISNGATTLSSMDLSSIEEILSEWKLEDRIIEPYDFTYIKGFSIGRTYQRNAFIFVPDELIDDEAFLYITGVEFFVDTYKNGLVSRTKIYAIGDYENRESFIDATQEVLDNNEIPLTISLDGNILVLTSTKLGAEFHIGSEEHPNAVRIFSTDVDGYGTDLIKGVNKLMYDYCPAYIPPFKYKNGAFKGVCIKPLYPIYNSDFIPETAKALKIAFIPNRVEMTLPVQVDSKLLYDKRCFTVLADHSDVIEKQEFEKWRDVDNTMKCDTLGYIQSLSNRNVLGLYGFINHVYENNLWLSTGTMFMNLAPTDSQDTADKNLIPSFVVYNPNPFPVQLSCMLYA